MRYMINVAEILPGRKVTEIRHYCEIRLATLSETEARDILASFQCAWPILHKQKDARFEFKLVGIEEYDL